MKRDFFMVTSFLWLSQITMTMRGSAVCASADEARPKYIVNERTAHRIAYRTICMRRMSRLAPRRSSDLQCKFLVATPPARLCDTPVIARAERAGLNRSKTIDTRLGGHDCIDWRVRCLPSGAITHSFRLDSDAGRHALRDGTPMCCAVHADARSARASRPIDPGRAIRRAPARPVPLP